MVYIIAFKDSDFHGYMKLPGPSMGEWLHPFTRTMARHGHIGMVINPLIGIYPAW